MNQSDPLHVFYGGTFDPVHNGHLAIACAAREALTADISFIPAADPPHRAPPGASARDRAEMVRLAITGHPGLQLDLRELERGGRSWSIDTLRALREQLGPDAAVAWLVGADSFIDLPSWKDWRSLFDLTHFIVAPRAGHALADAGMALQQALQGRWVEVPGDLLKRPAGCVFALKQPLQWHSATQLRERIAAGLAWQEMVPVAVAGYIVEHGLYGVAPTGGIIGA
jgi:nicotinate-nucleotide adenylyltransferase